jgi:hypothetical protein
MTVSASGLRELTNPLVAQRGGPQFSFWPWVSPRTG